MPSEFPKKVVHGGKIQEMRRIFGESLLDVSASMNPFVPEFSCAYNHADLAVYPDDSYTALKEKISSVFGRDSEEICVGNRQAWCAHESSERKCFKDYSDREQKMIQIILSSIVK